MKNAIRILSPQERKVLLFSYGIDGREKKTNREIAEEIGISIGTVVSRRRQAENKIRSVLLCF